MVSEHYKDEIWQRMYDANILSRYYSKLSDKYQFKHNFVRGILFFSSQVV